MIQPPRPLFALILGSLMIAPLGLLVSASRGEAAALAPALPGDAALNHWVFDIGEVDVDEARRHAREVVAHRKQAHPGVHFEIYRTSSLEGVFELHVLLETVNTTAQRVFLDEPAQDETCRAQLQFEGEQFEVVRDAYLRLIASDPEKEKRMGPQGGTIIWSLRSRFPRAGEAVDSAAEIARHLNATYPGFYVRAYDEWFPRSGRIHFYIHGSSISGWEAAEAAMRQDPVFRELMGKAAGAFVEDSFEDLWIVSLAR